MTNVRWNSLATLTMLMLPTATAASDALLFEDPAGDAGPLAAWGMPVPGLANDHADLLSATIRVEGPTALLTLTLAALPSELPPDIVYFAGWTTSDGAYLGVGYTRVVTADAPSGHEGAQLCAFEGSPQEDAEPECVEIAATRERAAFVFAFPTEALVDGLLSEPTGAVVRLPDATAWPLFVAHFTGMTVEDLAAGEDVALEFGEENGGGVVAQGASEVGQRAVPLGGAIAALAGIGLSAWARRSTRASSG